jgi:hypothetical protein
LGPKHRGRIQISIVLASASNRKGQHRVLDVLGRCGLLGTTIVG